MSLRPGLRILQYIVKFSNLTVGFKEIAKLTVHVKDVHMLPLDCEEVAKLTYNVKDVPKLSLHFEKVPKF